ncbi:UNVERIFIED_CONTAM: hypothetical protein NCL1_29000 [Trichonephila clavipes]
MPRSDYVRQVALETTTTTLHYILLAGIPVLRTDVAVVPFQQQHVCEIQLVQWFLYLSGTPCKLQAEDAELGSVRVFQQPVEMPDIQHDVDAELGTVRLSQQPVEMPDIQHDVDAELGTALPMCYSDL